MLKLNYFLADIFILSAEKQPIKLSWRKIEWLPASGTEMPEHIEAFLQEKYEAILRGASGRKFIYKEGEWRLIFTFFPTDRVVDERYALKNKVQMINKVQMKSKS